jgi:ubiquinone/menaquinone biosynthesis C-methylase UbiE
LDRQKYSTIGHTDHRLCNPLSEAKIDSIFSLIPLTSNDMVLDVGCGKGEMLIRLAERYAMRGMGIDINASFLAEARQNANTQLGNHQLEFIEKPAEAVEIAPHSIALGMCIGSTHAYGTLEATLTALAKVVRPGGHILVADGYWKIPPAPEYLEVLGATEDEMGTHADNLQKGIDAGLIPFYSTTSSEEEWDNYEGLYGRAIQRYAYQYPEDADSVEMQTRIQAWQIAYHRWGRATLGFGVYLFLRP